ncbi:MAG: hypothetical protein D6820_15870 [Lentisphaerae bacterium]|nr:MAG: hypothetical protein D6820_15870 [Lentisphaerota bacterium]
MQHIELRPRLQRAFKFFALSFGAVAACFFCLGLIITLTGSNTGGELNWHIIRRVLLFVGPVCGVIALGYPVFYAVQSRKGWRIYEDRVEIIEGNRVIREIAWEDIRDLIFRENSIGLDCMDGSCYNLAFLDNEQLDLLAAWYNRKRELPIALTTDGQEE